MTISLIVAVSDNYGIGINNSLPWGHIPQDMKWFKDNTAGKIVVMGSSTWDSLPRKPLPNRTNVVLSSRGSIPDTHYVFNDAPLAVIKSLQTMAGLDAEICIMGGAKVYSDFMPFVDKIYLTRIRQNVSADTFLPIDKLMEINNTNGVEWQLSTRQEYFDPQHVTFEVWVKE